MQLEDYFPVWDKLTPTQQFTVRNAAFRRSVPAGTLLHNGTEDCIGLFLIGAGQLRAYIRSPEGKEVTVYRLFARDICLFSASCMLSSLQFDLTIEAQKDSELWVIPPDVYKQLMENSLAVANYTNQVMASRLSEVMWLVEQVMWKSFDRRLADFLLQESNLDEADTLQITHDKIAAHMGTAREVVTRMLRYFQQEGYVALARGTVTLTDKKALQGLAES